MLPNETTEKLELIAKITRAAIDSELPAHFFEELNHLKEYSCDEIRCGARKAFMLCLQEFDRIEKEKQYAT